MKNLKIWSLALTLLLALVGCDRGDEKVDNGGKKAPFKPVATSELATKIVNKWQLKEYAGQPAELDVFIDFKADASYELYERSYGYEYEYRSGAYKLEGDVLTGTYVDGEKWNNEYTIQIADKPLRLRMIEANGVYGEYEMVAEVPSTVEGAAPIWDGEFRQIPAPSGNGFIEITHPGQLATLLSETDAEAFVAAGKKVRIMKDLYFNNKTINPVVDMEYFRDFLLDGNGHALYDIVVECEAGQVAALFPEVVSAQFYNLTLNNIKVDAGEGENAYAGTLIGTSYGDVVLQGVQVKNSVVKGTNKVGGLVGFVAQDSITAVECGVVNSTVETHNVANESGLAGGFIGFISCTEETPVAKASTIEDCYVENVKVNAINAANEAKRANSEFIGGINGNDGDVLYINNAVVKDVTLSDEATTPLYAKLIGGTRGYFTVCVNGTADYNGYISEALPEAKNKVVEIETPSQFAALLTLGANDLTVVLKNNFDFKGATLTPLYNPESAYVFSKLVVDGNEKSISNLELAKGAQPYLALFPDAVDVTVKDLSINSLTVDAGEGENAYAGALIGRSYGATVVENVTVNKSTIKGTNKIGGLVGLVAENSINVTKCTVTNTLIETYDVAGESGLAGGLIGYIASTQTAFDESVVTDSNVIKCTFNVINSEDAAKRANSEFIGGIGGKDGDLLIIDKLTKSGNTWNETGATTYKPYNEFVGGIRGQFTVSVAGVAYWNGCYKALPEANDKGVVEIKLPSEFATLVTEGATAGLKLAIKNNFDFNAETLVPLVDLSKFTALEIDGGSMTVANFAVATEGTVAALFPVVSGINVKNLKIAKASVDAGKGDNAYAGALIGRSYGNIVLTNVDVEESIIKGTNKVGGLVGFVAEDSITAKNCDVLNSTVETHKLEGESGLAGGLIGYIGCQNDLHTAKSSIETCTVKESTLTFINSTDAVNRANSQFIGGIGGDADDELVIKKATVENNTYTETGVTEYKPFHELIGGLRGEFKVTVDGKKLYTEPEVEEPEVEKPETTEPEAGEPETTEPEAGESEE